MLILRDLWATLTGPKPNAETQEVMREIEAGNVTRFDSVDALMDDLNDHGIDAALRRRKESRDLICGPARRAAKTRAKHEPIRKNPPPA